MASFEELKAERIKKLEALKKAGIDPYPSNANPTSTIKDAVEKFDDFVKHGESVTLVGRVMAFRPQGGLAFMNLNDGTATFQGLVKKEEMDERLFDLFLETVDIGDFVEITGTLFTTKRGEKTVQIKEWRMLSKSIRPLPEKWHGIQDTEERLRKRYLDILFNEDVREMIEKKTQFWNFTREYLQKSGFIEVETPTLEVTTGGAEANPFKTHHKDFDLDVYLRISVGELWQKKLLAAGLPKIFEIGRAYRNEGTSAEHTQEFTNLEFYAAYMDYQEGMEFTEKMIKELAQTVFGTSTFSARGFTFNLEGEWPRLRYVDAVREKTGIDILTATEQEMKDKLAELRVQYDGDTKERLADTLWKYCRKQIAGPVWLIDHPKFVSPLTKSKNDTPMLVERVQLILAGAEATNGYSELNDPIDQRERFEEQQKLIERGDTEAMMPDWEFVEMLEYGMPPAFGFAYGDRLFSFFVNKPLRETQIFPLMRPKKEE